MKAAVTDERLQIYRRAVDIGWDDRSSGEPMSVRIARLSMDIADEEIAAAREACRQEIHELSKKAAHGLAVCKTTERTMEAVCTCGKWKFKLTRRIPTEDMRARMEHVHAMHTERRMQHDRASGSPVEKAEGPAMRQDTPNP